MYDATENIVRHIVDKNSRILRLHGIDRGPEYGYLDAAGILPFNVSRNTCVFMNIRT